MRQQKCIREYTDKSSFCATNIVLNKLCKNAVLHCPSVIYAKTFSFELSDTFTLILNLFKVYYYNNNISFVLKCDFVIHLHVYCKQLGTSTVHICFEMLKNIGRAHCGIRAKPKQLHSLIIPFNNSFINLCIYLLKTLWWAGDSGTGDMRIYITLTFMRLADVFIQGLSLQCIHW